MQFQRVLNHIDADCGHHKFQVASEILKGDGDSQLTAPHRMFNMAKKQYMQHSHQNGSGSFKQNVLAAPNFERTTEGGGSSSPVAYSKVPPAWVSNNSSHYQQQSSSSSSYLHPEASFYVDRRPLPPTTTASVASYTPSIASSNQLPPATTYSTASSSIANANVQSQPQMVHSNPLSPRTTAAGVSHHETSSSYYAPMAPKPTAPVGVYGQPMSFGEQVTPSPCSQISVGSGRGGLIVSKENPSAISAGGQVHHYSSSTVQEQPAAFEGTHVNYRHNQVPNSQFSHPRRSSKAAKSGYGSEEEEMHLPVYEEIGKKQRRPRKQHRKTKKNSGCC